MEHKGYEKQRFSNLKVQAFDCILCGCVAKKPRECSGCQNIYCSICITVWAKQNNGCPNRCNSTLPQLTNKALLKMYNDLDIKCQFYDKCKKIVKMYDLEKHESSCGKPKCWNNVNCQGNADIMENGFGFCTPKCAFVKRVLDCKNDQGKLYEEVKKYLPALVISQPKLISNISFKGGFKWDANKTGLGVEISQEGQQAWLSESGYCFRSVIADIGFSTGVHYWEIVADPRTQNELKVGVTTNKQFNLNSAFCDYPHGFGYYGLGSLRYNSNSTGPSYGKKFKNSGVLGVCLNMDKGTLSFALDGEFWGIAYTNQSLTKGPIYPAIAILHCGGCKIKGGNLPEYFKDA